MLHQSSLDRKSGCSARNSLDGATSAGSWNSISTNKDRNAEEFLEGCSLLHLACKTPDLGMIELLLQYGADINSRDSRGRTPLHHFILGGRTVFAKQLLSRGADPHAVDVEGKAPLHYAVDSNFNDSEVLSPLADTETFMCRHGTEGKASLFILYSLIRTDSNLGKKSRLVLGF